MVSFAASFMLAVTILSCPVVVVADLQLPHVHHTMDSLICGTDGRVCDVEGRLDSDPEDLSLLQREMQLVGASLSKPSTDNNPHHADKPKKEFNTGKDLTPLQYLMISSPSQKKVVYTTLVNFEASHGTAFALIDTGLEEPRGLAFDHQRGYLYVADSGAEKIFRYTILHNPSGSPALTVAHARITVVQGCGPVEWVTVDTAGNLFYAAPKTNNINKIATKVMQRIAKGEIQARNLKIISEKSLEAHAAAPTNPPDALPTDSPPIEAHIYSIYEAKLNPHVSKPGKIWADGDDLYWTNQKDGTTAGTVVLGQVNPKVVRNNDSSPAPFPASPLTNSSSGAISLAKTDKMMFWTRGGEAGGPSAVTGLLLGTDVEVDIVSSLTSPKGLVWDKDQTMFVADEGNGQVFSFPIGRVMSNAPLTLAVSVKGCYDMLILSSKDPCFLVNKVGSKNVGSKNVEEAEDVEDVTAVGSTTTTTTTTTMSTMATNEAGLIPEKDASGHVIEHRATWWNRFR